MESSILFSERGRLDTAYLADFGLSVHLDDSTDIFYGPRGEGSCAYMAPEAEQDGQYSPVSDAWGLGAVLFCMLTGKIPPQPWGSEQVHFDKARDAWTSLSLLVRSLINVHMGMQSSVEELEIHEKTPLGRQNISAPVVRAHVPTWHQRQSSTGNIALLVGLGSGEQFYFAGLLGKSWGSEQVLFDKARDAWTSLSLPVCRLIKGMLCPNAHLQLTLEQMLQHAWTP